MPSREWYLLHLLVTTAAGVPASNPQQTTLITGDNIVNWVGWRFPPGPAGHLAVSFWHGERRILPWVGAGTVVTGDDETIRMTVQAEVFGQLDVYTYNTGTHPHSIMVMVEYQPVSVLLEHQAPVVPLPPLLHRAELLSSELMVGTA